MINHIYDFLNNINTEIQDTLNKAEVVYTVYQDLMEELCIKVRRTLHGTKIVAEKGTLGYLLQHLLNGIKHNNVSSQQCITNIGYSQQQYDKLLSILRKQRINYGVVHTETDFKMFVMAKDLVEGLR